MSPESSAPATAPRGPMSPERIAAALGLPAPTPEQSRVIAHPLSPLLVVAGAGSGKTATMSQRVVHLVATGAVRPDQVLGLTFTRKATAELAQRVATRLAQLAESGLVAAPAQADEPATPTIATYNSFAGTIVREHGLRIGVDPDATLITEARAWQVASRLIEARTEPLPLETLGSATQAVLRLDAALSENLLEPQDAARDLEDLAGLFEGLAAIRGCKSMVGRAPQTMRQWHGTLEAAIEYRDYKRSHGLLDFGDQISLACRIAESSQEVRAQLRAQYPAVLLDEFQDTSVAQLRLLSALFAGSGVTAVGDPHQAIYGWRGASAGALDTFHARFNPAAGSPGTSSGAAPVLPLSTAWRNDPAILQAANAVSSPLRHHTPEPGDSPIIHIPVEPLRPRPRGDDATGAGASTAAGDPAAGPPEASAPEHGLMAAAYLQDPLQEARTIADFLSERWSPQAQMAVLCRARSLFPPIAQALQEAGLPVSIVGLGGMLAVPEVADLRALLGAAADPERGDRLMRLLTGAGIGAADLAALHGLARRLLTGPRAAPDEHSVEAPLVSEALEAIVREEDGAVPVPGLSPTGRGIALRLGRQLRAVRSGLHLPLPELLALAEQALGLDIELAARLGDPMGRRALDAFHATAQQYAADIEAPTLAGFLTWLETAEERENGMEAPEVEPEPGAVQLLTIHASKGLEWDTVVVAGMTEGGFPSYRKTPPEDLVLTESGWMTSQESFPHPLRADAQTLPPFELGALEPGATDKDTVKDLWEQYTRALGRHAIAEERRLAYVAITRARHHVLLTGSHLAKTSQKPKPPSRFLDELHRRGMLTAYGPGWVEPDPQAINPLAEEVRTGWWPPQGPAVEPGAESERAAPGPGAGSEQGGASQPQRGPGEGSTLSRARLAAARSVQAAMEAAAQPGAPELLDGEGGTACPVPDRGPSPAAAAPAEPTAAGAPGARPARPTLDAGGRDPGAPGGAEEDPLVARWCSEAALLLAERARVADEPSTVRIPSHLAATRLDDLRKDPAAFALDLRRPLPPQPRAAGRLGTVFHEAIAQRLSARGTLLSLLEAGIPETLGEPDRRRIERWLETAQSIPLLADYVLVDTEVERELSVGGTTLRCRMDAVFEHADGGRWLIVDWKTGRRRVPVDQLSVYVHAWAASQGVRAGDVRAAYIYVDEPGGAVEQLGEAELLSLERITDHLTRLA
ncbi:ATP-dependent helicase [Actinomyces bowdenii]|uniref:DNA 3'-5' helicase n=1 Tax=Actinomyces bowdenii TaxID=131109 RepID=A0A3P1UWE9_9ACTO|nr:ATP-dependent DNA helicase [Actinomyces bowdenii]MBO3724870.1 ATP-dependent helicase [Actinomyces bowdenii]RRD26112.1 ATP-dependent helicase [Actinomyces bowdenii]